MTARPPLPVGFSLLPDPSARVARDGRLVWGGTPWRMLRLSAAGAVVADRLLGGDPVADLRDGALARHLVDGGLAHPVPPDLDEQPLTVVVPARDRAEMLERCLAALRGVHVVVVDDGSDDPRLISDACADHGATLVRLDESSGPAAARNLGLSHVDTDVVAFVDSDAVVDDATLRGLAEHLADPAVGAVAPRVRPDLTAGAGALGDYVAARSPLDLGTVPALVRPGGRVAYVPSTVLVARRSAVTDIRGFDERLRYGEDVDLCWRMYDAGWSVRYDPSLAARHAEPRQWSALLRRRFRYGTSAGPLAVRHPGRLRGPSLRGVTAAAQLARRPAALPGDVAARLAISAPAATAAGLLRWGAPLWWPVAFGLRPRSLRRAALLAVVGAALGGWWRRRRTAPDPLRYVAASLADDAAYGAGVWAGVVRARCADPVLPRISASPRRADP